MATPTARSFALAALVACSPACGGEAPADTTAAGGAGGAGGAAATGSTTVSASASGVGGAGSTTASSTSAGGNDYWPWGFTCFTDAGAVGRCLYVSDCVGDSVPFPGNCPGPSSYQCCVDTGGVCDPAGAPQPNVGLSEDPGEGGCPEGMLRIDGTYCIDRYEASLRYVADDEPFSPYVNPGMSAVRAVSIAGAVPQAYIDQLSAADACAASGKRLCTDTEWLRACEGPSGTTYPYGDSLVQGACNDARAVHPAVEYFGTTDAWIYSELGNACIDQLPDSLAGTGTHPDCVTAEGAFDMMGNLHEWTADPNGTFRGGFYVDTVKNGPGCLYTTTAHDVTHWDYSTGFRCCAD